MPNWCMNSLKLRHADKAMLHRAKAAFLRGDLLKEFVPVPEQLANTTSGFFGDEDKQRALEEQQQKNVEQFGYATWYDFCLANWGTKWDVGGGKEGTVKLKNGELTFSFESAWSPPVEAYHRFVELGFEVEAMFYEPGCAFCGRFNSELGEETISISGNSDWVSENIPEDIEQEFDIIGHMEMWEEEE